MLASPESFIKISDRMKLIATKFLALIACGLMLGASAAGAIKPITDLPKALAAAKAQKQPVFVYVFDSI